MSYSSYKTFLLRLAQLSLRNPEYNYVISKRYYAKQKFFSSPSPQRYKTKRIVPLRQAERGYEHYDNTKLQEEEKEEFTDTEIEDKQELLQVDKNFKRNEEGDIERVHAKYNRKLSDDPKYQTKFSYDEYVSEQKERYTILKKLPHEDTPDLKNEKLQKKVVVVSSNQEKTSSNNKRLDEEESNQIISKFMAEADIVATEDATLLEGDFDWSKENKLLKRSKFIDTPEGRIAYDLSKDEFDTNKFALDMMDNIPEPLDECNEDLSDLGPNSVPTFNFAAYADNSKIIQEFTKLGVELYKLEKNQDHMRSLLSVDLNKDLPRYIQFLTDCGVPADNLGDVITKNPMIFQEDMDDLKTRIRYLRAHNFTKQSVARIVTLNPLWLNFTTKLLDERLGHFQNEFYLSGREVRFLATKQPRLITYNMKNIHENTFSVREEMGFNRHEMKVILLDKPRLWMNSRTKILDSFMYLHHTMNLPHLTIASNASILTCRKRRIETRHEFLLELKRAQYDPKKPGFVSLTSLAAGSDLEFCADIAKASIETYNLFLKTR